MDAVAESFRTDADARRATVERIAQRVGRYFRVEARRLQGRDRSRQALLPRQVGMYLARRLTDLSLEQIGAYFGGRDHSTVLHACRKVEQALADDLVLSGAVRQLQADLDESNGGKPVAHSAPIVGGLRSLAALGAQEDPARRGLRDAAATMAQPRRNTISTTDCDGASSCGGGTCGPVRRVMNENPASPE